MLKNIITVVAFLSIFATGVYGMDITVKFENVGIRDVAFFQKLDSMVSNTKFTRATKIIGIGGECQSFEEVKPDPDILAVETWGYSPLLSI